jgi:hypothetical protein
MSSNGGSDAKYDLILQKLAELKALAEATDRKVGVLHAEKTGKMEAARKEEERKEAARKVREKQDAEERERRLQEKQKAEQRLAESAQRKSEKDQAQHDHDMVHKYGLAT